MKVLEPDERQPRARIRVVKSIIWVTLALSLTLLAERWRGQWKLKNWKQRMAARGEAVEIDAVWPKPTPQSELFSNLLAQATQQRSGRLGHYSGTISGMVVQQPGFCRRGSREDRPPLGQSADRFDSWADLEAAVSENQPMLESLRSLLKDPPGAVSYDAAKALRNDFLPNFVGQRVAAQTLHAAVIGDLHRDDLDAALKNLGALLSFSKLNEQDPTLVCYMIRMAILGLSVDACWDALQADGWTDEQLAAFQMACPDSSRLLSQMPRVLEAERVGRVAHFETFRSVSYRAWAARYSEIFTSFGAKPLSSDAGQAAMIWRQWVFHPLWSFAWADQEELEFVQQEQLQIQALKEATKNHSYEQLNERLAAVQKDYRAPLAAWRFYFQIPFSDFMVSAINKKVARPIYPCPDYSRAWSTTMKNLTLNNLVTTALALKRYQLKHGTLPQDLVALAPAFFPAVPLDLMDGQPLRYHLYPNGSFILYSVGVDGKDEKGNPLPAEDTPSGNLADSPWEGRDLLWPRMTLGLLGHR